MIYPTPSEIVAAICHSSFPTVVTEGSDDVIVYRRLEEELSELGVSIIAAGGRNAVLEVHSLRHQIPTSKKYALIIDQDTWVYTGIPLHYRDAAVVCTWGYSVENDMFADGELLNLLDAKGRLAFQADTNKYLECYCVALGRHLSGQSVGIDFHPNSVCDDPARYALHSLLRPDEAYPDDLKVKIKQELEKMLRGKALFALLVRQLKGFNSRTLLQFGASRRGANFQAILSRVREQLM